MAAAAAAVRRRRLLHQGDVWVADICPFAQAISRVWPHPGAVIVGNLWVSLPVGELDRQAAWPPAGCRNLMDAFDQAMMSGRGVVGTLWRVWPYLGRYELK